MPNLPVDVSSWGRSACYPRGTFYPLSDDPSTQNHRITMTDFRLCSTCLSYSQAGLCHYRFQSLPPILRIMLPSAVSSCSKGPRGLSVLPRVGGIFTSTTISLNPWLRQLPSRYAIHAGRYLTDKEFRYLRTVIVTAAVYSGFNSKLRIAAD